MDAGKLTGADEIGVRVGKVVNQYKVAKHFELDIGERTLHLRAQARQHRRRSGAGRPLHHPHLGRRAAQMDAPDCVRNYKSLANVERAFRSLKTVDLKVRPIHHRLADRVRAHIFLCMLAYYVEWHMREAWRELMFADTDQAGQGHARSRRAGQALAGGAGQGAPPTPSMTAPPRTASPPCWPNSPPSCATPAARLAQAPMRPPSTWPPRANPKQQRALELIQQIKP